MTDRKEQTRRMRRDQVECWLAAVMTVRAWCSTNGVSASMTYYWMARFRKDESRLFGDPTCEEWIELSRGSLAAWTALAVREAGAADAGEVGVGGTMILARRGKMLFHRTVD